MLRNFAGWEGKQKQDGGKGKEGGEGQEVEVWMEVEEKGGGMTLRKGASWSLLGKLPTMTRTEAYSSKPQVSQM